MNDGFTAALSAHKSTLPFSYFLSGELSPAAAAEFMLMPSFLCLLCDERTDEICAACAHPVKLIMRHSR
jgi:hypothetical protein